MVIVTYNRCDQLSDLMTSVSAMTAKPACIVVVNNNSTDGTAELLDGMSRSGTLPRLIVLHMDQNTGGAGGFATGMSRAFEEAVDWIYCVDDDVVALPDALQSLHQHSTKYKAVVGGRQHKDGSHFIFQQYFNESLGIHLHKRGEVFANSDVWETNLCTFEGLLLHRSIYEKVGTPDPRFFLTWDDVMYGYAISQHTPIAVINEETLRRTSNANQIHVKYLRHLSASSDISRFYVLRNRGLVAEHLQNAGKWKPVMFAFGTAIVVMKELMRMVFVERSLRGFPSLVKGYFASRKLKLSSRVHI